MWGLVHPSLLNGEGGYYLTTLTSAVQVVKQLKFGNLALDEEKPANQVCLGSLRACWTLMHVWQQYSLVMKLACNDRDVGCISVRNTHLLYTATGSGTCEWGLTACLGVD